MSNNDDSLKNHAKKALGLFLDGNISPAELRDVLSPWLNFRLQDETPRAVDVIAPFQIEIIIFPRHVISMLRKYINGAIDSIKVRDWAAYLVIMEQYVASSDYTSITEDDCEKMWEIIQELSTPEIDGELTKFRAKNYLNTLTDMTIC